MTHMELNCSLGLCSKAKAVLRTQPGASVPSQEQDSLITQMPSSLAPSLILWSFFQMAHSTCYCHGISALLSPCSRIITRLPQQPSGLQKEGKKSNSAPNKVRPQGFWLYLSILMFQHPVFMVRALLALLPQRFAFPFLALPTAGLLFPFAECL